MRELKIILPMDGYSSEESLLTAISGFFNNPQIKQHVSHIKLNDGVHWFGTGGPAIIRDISDRLRRLDSKAKIFLDLKVFDVSVTLANTLKKYCDAGHAPDILTVSASCSVEGIIKLRTLLPDTRLAMVSVLTDISQDECLVRFGQVPGFKIYNDLENIRRIYKKEIETNLSYASFNSSLEPFDLVVCSAHELGFLKRNLGDDYGYIVPGIRDEWMKKPDEHQKRVVGVREALDRGATYVVMGAQITKGNPALDITPEESQARTIAEIDKSSAGLVVRNNPLGTLQNCRGYYESPKDESGKYVGPVVGYAKRYLDDHIEKQMAGFIYLNWAKGEQVRIVNNYVAQLIAKKVKLAGVQANVVIGMPMGGLRLSGSIGDALETDRVIFMEKIVTEAANKEKKLREKSHLVVERHDLYPGDKVIFVEDVVNNCSTVEEAMKVIEGYGAEPAAIVCGFNRSGLTDFVGIPIIAACNIALEQYKQDAPEVKDLIAAGNFVPKPKMEWEKLSQAMEKGKQL